MTRRKLKIAEQSQYITELEYKLKSLRYNAELPVAVQENSFNNQALFELKLDNSSLKSAIEISKQDFEELIKWQNTERLYFEIRIIQLETDVNRLNEE